MMFAAPARRASKKAKFGHEPTFKAREQFEKKDDYNSLEA